MKVFVRILLTAIFGLAAFLLLALVSTEWSDLLPVFRTLTHSLFIVLAAGIIGIWMGKKRLVGLSLIVAVLGSIAAYVGDDFAVRQQHLPVKYIFVGHNSLPNKYPSVTIDNLGGARAMAHHFVEQNYSSILLIAGPKDNVDSNDRIFGFKLGLNEKGYGGRLFEAGYGDFSRKSGYAIAADFFGNNKVDAVFAVNDRTALGVMLYLKEIGLEIPKETAVAGFDDAYFADCINPPLTTVRQPMYDMGFQAMHNLLLLLEGSPLPNQQVILPAPLIIRKSC